MTRVCDTDEDGLACAARALTEGNLVAYPTEGVYGLGCDPRSDRALTHLLALKGRPVAKGFILIADRWEVLAPFVQTDVVPLVVSLPLQPAPCTWIFPAAPSCPALLHGEHETVAVRVTAHPVAARLSALFGGAIVSTSANPSGGRAARTASEVRQAFPHGLAVILDGPLGGLTGPTEIRDARDGRVIRAAPR
jgi:L-threonylcarbamoyladenylate synthase